MSHTILGILAGCLLIPSTANASHDERPNFIVVLADDLGYGDLGCYGHPVIETPHLDRFAAEGMRFSSCYSAAPNCSPARTGLMTGRVPYRVGVHNWVPLHSPMHLRKREITIATLLRQAGYATCHVGKWHLNGLFNLPGQPQPSDHGFDDWFSTQNNALPNHRNPNNFVRNGKPVGRLQGYASQIVVDEAIGWLTDRRDTSKPFFLYLCFHEPHEPIATDKRFAERYPSNDPSYSAHHGNITQMDDAFGRLMQAVHNLGFRENTLVFFTSDNGPAITSIHPHGSTGGLRKKKGYLYEGGIRVPGIIRWPGHTQPRRICDEPISGVDVLPTLCEIAGVPAPRDRAIDGTSILPVFEGEAIRRETPLYWQFNFPRSGPKVALRWGDWKLLAYLTGPTLGPTSDITAEATSALQTAELSSMELFNLRDDVAETKDLAGSHSVRAEKMSETLRKMFSDIQSESPTWPVWKSPRHESKLIQWPPYRKKGRAPVKPKGQQSS